MNVDVPDGCSPGLHVLVADLAWEGTVLREWAEAVIEVGR
jgi:hypothetical protein